MSLINKALKDLERRQGGDAQAAIPAEVRLAPVLEARRGAQLVIALGLAACAGIGGTWFVMGGGAPGATRVAAAEPAPALAPPVALPVKLASQAESQREQAPQVAPQASPAQAPQATPTPAARSAGFAAAVPATAATAATPAAPAAPAVKAAPDLPAVRQAAVDSRRVATEPPRAAPFKMAAASTPVASERPRLVAASPAAMQPLKSINFPGVLKTPLPMFSVASLKLDAPAPPRGTAAPTAAPTVAAVEPRMEKTVSPAQLSSNLQAQAMALLQQGNRIDARPLLRRALQANPANGAARQLLADVLVEGNGIAEATALLREGVQVTPERSSLWMSLARLELEQGAPDKAATTLEKGLPHALQDAQYHAFYAALLQRSGRHEEAVTHYIAALRADPAMPSWLVGAGISLQALGKNSDALEAYVRARDGGRLQDALVAFVEQRIDQLK